MEVQRLLGVVVYRGNPLKGFICFLVETLIHLFLFFSRIFSSMMLFLHLSIGITAILCVGTAQSVWEESTVVPVRLDPTARSESQTEPWRTLSAEEKEKEAEMREYRLDVFGKVLVLQLEPDQTFLAPGFVFHIVGSPDSEPTQKPKTGAEPGCFFSGTVNGEEHSAAALNLCHGLRGGFYFQGEEYFIQPLNSSDFLGTEEDVHMIRRRGRAVLAEEGSTKCGVNEDEERVPKNLEKEPGHGATDRDQTGKTVEIVVNLTLQSYC